MGYTTVKEDMGAIEASRRLREARRTREPAASAVETLPLLVDQVTAEAGIHDTAAVRRAIAEADGDIARAVSLLRVWASCLPRLADSHCGLDDIELDRRITPAFREPAGGQYLGASLDYAPRLFMLENPATPSHSHAGTTDNTDWSSGKPATGSGTRSLKNLPRAAAELEREDLLERGPVASLASGNPRRLLREFLSSADTGALTALAYSAVRGDVGAQAEPVILELRVGDLPIWVDHPDGSRVRVGHVPATLCEVALYRIEVGEDGETVDPRFTGGFGATVGNVERRAIAAAVLDARVSRARNDPPEAPRPPADDAEWLMTVLDGQQAAGFVEHYKLAHHVTFTSDIDRVRSVRTSKAAGKDSE